MFVYPNESCPLQLKILGERIKSLLLHTFFPNFRGGFAPAGHKVDLPLHNTHTHAHTVQLNILNLPIQYLDTKATQNLDEGFSAFAMACCHLFIGYTDNYQAVSTHL